jgi:hypothetical protein
MGRRLCLGVLTVAAAAACSSPARIPGSLEAPGRSSAMTSPVLATAPSPSSAVRTSDLGSRTLSATPATATALTRSVETASSSSSSASSSAPTANKFPAVFVAWAPHGIGLRVYSSLSGALVRKLTGTDGDGAATTVTRDGWVYFTRRPVNGSCLNELWRVPLTGGRASRVAEVGRVDGSVAVSADGRLLAYANLDDACTRNGAMGLSYVEVVNLRTGRRHRIDGQTADPAALAWARDGRTLAVVTATDSSGADRIRLVRNPFHAARITDGSVVPCPTAISCWQESPSYAADGTLAYVAMIVGPCAAALCHQQPYDVVLIRHGHLAVVDSQEISTGSLTSGAIDDAGTAVIYSLPAGAAFTIWRWSGGPAVPIGGEGGHAYNPTW